MKRQQCVHGPAMVRAPRRHGRGRLLRMGHTLMGCAKVLDRAHHEHALVQRQGMAGQRPAPARQRREVFPERRVQPFAGRRRDPPAALRATPAVSTRAGVPSTMRRSVSTTRRRS